MGRRDRAKKREREAWTETDGKDDNCRRAMRERQQSEGEEPRQNQRQ